MRHHPKIFLLALLALLFTVPGHARAQSAAFEGTYVYAPNSSDNIEKAINQAVAKMNFVTRPVARGRLKKTNTPYDKIRIDHTSSEVSIVTDDRAPIVTPANGTPVKWRREDGEVFDVSTEWENGKLEQTFKADDGQRINVYSLSEDGNTLTMHVTVSSPRLPQPVTYNLVFRRES